MIQQIEMMYEDKKEKIDMVFNTLDRATARTVMMFSNVDTQLNNQGVVISDLHKNGSQVLAIKHDLNNMTVVCTAYENNVPVADLIFSVFRKEDFFTATFKKVNNREFKKIINEWFDDLEDTISYDDILPIKEEVKAPTDVEIVEGSEDGNNSEEENSIND